MRNIAYLFVLIGLFALNACKDANKKVETATISGDLSHAVPEKLIYLYEMTPMKNILLDSCAVKDSKFSFTLHNKQAGFYNISIDKGNFVTLLVDTNETINYKGDFNRLYYNYAVTGSRGSILLKEFNDNRQKAVFKIDSLKKLINKKMYAEDFAKEKPKIDSAFEHLFTSERKFAEDFINKNANSLVSIIALYQPLGMKKLFNADKDYGLYIKVDSLLSKRYPQSIHIQAIHSEVVKSLETRKQIQESLAKLKQGKYAPDLLLPDLDGNPHKLSDLKDKSVILYFWAGCNKASRTLNKDLVNLYKQYKKQRLAVYAVSLDMSKGDWKAAVEDDKLKWINVSGLGNIDSEAAKTYNIKEIPCFYLLDTANLIVNMYSSVNKLGKAVDSLMKKY